jgi:hypothetical protein
MSAAGKLIVGVAGTLPAVARNRYREEWLADLDGARELGLSEWSVLGGAVTTAITIDRTDPQVTGIPRAHLARNRTRWVAAFLGSAVVLSGGMFLWGGYETWATYPIAFGFKALAFLFGALGLFASMGALVVALDADGRRTARALGIGALVLLGLLLSVMFVPFAGVLGIPVALAAFLIAVSGPREPVRSHKMPPRRRIMLALPFTVISLLLIAAGILHITVWNPVARVPGLSLTEIYLAMSAANETPVATIVIMWAACCGIAAVCLPILSDIPQFSSFTTTRRIVVAGLLVVGATAATQWVAGFNMGMSLADTFMTSGGDAAVSGPVIAIVGLAALIAALFVGLAPHRVNLGSASQSTVV